MGRDKILLAAIAIIVALAAFVVLDPLGDEGEQIEGTSRRRREAARDEDDAAPRRRPGGAGGTAETRITGSGAGTVIEDAPPIEKKDVFGVPYSAIVGRVTDEDGAAVAAANVALFDATATFGSSAMRGPLLARVESRGDGTFEFRDVEATRTYVIRGSHAAYMRYAASLTPREGETIRIDVVLGSGIDLEGVVTDAESGSLLDGAVVRVYDLDDATADPEDAVEVVAITDAEGAFRAANVSPGNKRLTASLDGFASATRPFVKINPSSASKSHDFALTAGLAISGEVHDLDGRPISGATVSARPVQGGSLHPEPRSHYPSTTSDGNGRFVVGGLGEGLYAVDASKPGFRQGSFGVAVDGNMPMRSKLNATGGDEGLILVLGPAPSIAGRVVDDETGAPVPAFRLTFNRSPLLGRVPPGSLRRVEDADGRFVYSLPPAVTTEGTLWLFALAPGYAGGSTEVDFQAGKGPGQGLERVSGITIRMKRGATIVGRVVDHRGRGIAGALVRVVPPHVMGAALDLFGRDVPPDPNAGTSARTDADGRFAVSRLRPGEHFLSVIHESFAELRLRDHVTVGEGGEIATGELTMVRGGRVHGVVRDSDGGGQEGAEVLLQTVELGAGAPQRTVRTGVGGAFDFRHVPPGRYSVSVVSINGIDFRSTDHALRGVKPMSKAVGVEEDGDIEVIF